MFQSLPQMLQELATTTHNNLLAHREHGQWHYLSLRSFRDQVAHMALALHKLGLKRGDSIAIIAEPSPYWLLIDLAAMSVGAVTVPVFSHIAPDIFEHQLNDADVRCCFVAGAEQWQLAQTQAKRWQLMITHDVPSQKDEHIYQCSVLMRVGQKERERDPDAFKSLIAAIQATDLATIIYTSGSTGMPKGVCLSHKNFCSQIAAAAERFPLHAQQDRALSCLPLAHVFERMVMYFYISSGINIYFADDITRVGDLLREVQPTCITMVPRLLEKVYAKILERAEASNFIKWRIAQWAFSEARENDPAASKDTWTVQLADHLVYSTLRESLGGCLRYVIVGGARLSPDLQRFFMNIGLPIYTGYGMSEASPVLAANFAEHNRFGSVGPAFPGVELKIGAQDEILARGPNVMLGYYGLPQKTAEVIDADGWLHTGDCGKIEDGYVYITGRIKELLKTSNGKYVAPVPIEQRLCESPVVDMAMITAEGRKCVGCLLFPDFEIVSKLKAEQGQEFVSNLDFLRSAFMRERMQKLIDSVNQHLNHWEQVRTYRFVDQVPSIEGEELTPTMKLRRHIIEAKYGDIIESMYEEMEHARP